MSSYDRVARFYDVDMARNMPFDDVGFYLDACRGARGRVLELGCGTGRILLALLAGGVDACGIDASAGMLACLRERAQARSLPAPVARMDLRALAFARCFAVVLCPYSLVTYLVGDDDLARAFAGIRAVLHPRGRLVIDAFVPKPAELHADFRLDYRRPFGDGVLARWKRITPTSARTNRIERRYQVLDAGERVLEQIDVSEEIRPVAPGELLTLVAAHGFAVEASWWDYARRQPCGEDRFFTVAARAD